MKVSAAVPIAVLVAVGLSGCGTTMMGLASNTADLGSTSCQAPASLPGTTVKVVEGGDIGMMRATSGVAPRGIHMMLRADRSQVAAGQVSFVVENVGWRTHELVVLPLKAGQRAGERMPGPDGRVSEEGSLGEASASCANGVGEGINSGTRGWVTLTLAPGTYELICNLPNHYADGMYQEITVR